MINVTPIEFEPARRIEWLETNGLGGFACSTILGMNSRRYHGLLTAAAQPPVGRLLLLSKLEETVVSNGERYELSVNQYPGVFHPAGHRFLEEFRADPFPTFRYRAGGLEIEKSVFMPHGENTVVVQYSVTGECELEIRPLIAFRGYHSTTHRNGALSPEVETSPGLASVQPYADLPRLYFAHEADAVEPAGHWYESFEFDIERQRGLDFREDLFNPFTLRFHLHAGTRVAIIVSTERHSASEAPASEARERSRRCAIEAAAPGSDPLVRALTVAADQFIVRRGNLRTIIAGYPWFGDWGRDTMIALPGLTLVTGRYEIARDILLAFAQSTDRGMLPNRFPDAGEQPEYNTVDATLWFFEAVRSYLHYTGDFDFVRQRMLPVLDDIVAWHVRGTRYGIRLDEEDGLLASGEPGVQLTWMDAKIGDWVVTPRTGKAVEIQALWYNALRVLEDLRRRAGDGEGAETASAMAERARASFESKFWNLDRGCLFDVVGQNGNDPAVRPNQIFAVSLHHPILRGDRAREVVATVEREMLTPAGLRSLSPRDPGYRGRYEGGVFERDSAYHQGTVWPWLMGPFLSASVRSHPDRAAAREKARERFRAFEPRLRENCLGQLCEINDAEQPYLPRGCFAQAWSVAELLRAAVEDLLSN